MAKRRQVVGYTRVSAAERTVGRHGLDLQETLIRSASKDHGWILIEIYTDLDRKSIGLDRPGLSRALERVSGPRVSGFVVSGFDRISNSVLYLTDLFERLIDARAVLATPAYVLDLSTRSGPDLAQAFISGATWGQDAGGRRIRDGQAETRAQGNPISRPSVADNPDLVKRIHHMRHDKRMSLQAIADELNADGIPTLRGGREWRPSSLQNAMYAPVKREDKG